MLDQELPFFNKGTFEKIDNNFMSEGVEVLQEVKVVQEKYHKNDTDTFINELRDSIVGYYLGFELINTDKHGFDCKNYGEGKDAKYLEVKAASFDTSSWGATFNDTTLEKADAFKDKKVFLALAVWKDASDLLFICYGQNKGIGDFLEGKVRWFKSGNTVRSTQSISLSTLVNTYGFNILTVDRTRQEIMRILQTKSRAFFGLSPNKIIELKDFKGI